MRWFALLLIFCVCVPLAAQDPIPDTTEVWRYFPLEIGNVWEYRDFDYFELSLYYLERIVVKRDTFIGEMRYFISNRTAYDDEGTVLSNFERVLRYDSVAAQIVRFDGVEEWPYAPTGCSFDVPFPPEGEQLECGPKPFRFVLGIGYNVPVQIGSDVVITAVKQYSFEIWTELRYASGIGHIGYEGCAAWCWDVRLTYANISGVEYGEPNPVANEQEMPGQEPSFAPRVYPNPAQGSIAIALVLDGHQPVSVEVFDLLGRRVYSEEHVAGARETAIHLDGSDWPRGLYLVRVTTADGQVATTRITRQ